MTAPNAIQPQAFPPPAAALALPQRPSGFGDFTMLLLAIQAHREDHINAWLTEGVVDGRPEAHDGRDPLGHAFQTWMHAVHANGSALTPQVADEQAAQRIVVALREGFPHPLGVRWIAPLVRLEPTDPAYLPPDSLFTQVCQHDPGALDEWWRAGLRPAPTDAPLRSIIDRMLEGRLDMASGSRYLRWLEADGWSLDTRYGSTHSARKQVIRSLLHESACATTARMLLTQWIERGDTLPDALEHDCFTLAQDPTADTHQQAMAEQVGMALQDRREAQLRANQMRLGLAMPDAPTAPRRRI